jgi:tetratricopeptide (TPR) repeat protein
MKAMPGGRACVSLPPHLARATGVVALAMSLWLLPCSSARGEGSYNIAAANRYVGARDWNGLVQYATAWTRAEPSNPVGWFYLGNTYGMGLARPDQALPAFQRAVTLQPKWPEAWDALGFVNVQLQRYDDAVKAFSRAVNQAPTRLNYRNSLAAAYSYAGRFSLAVKTLEDEQRTMGPSATFADWYNLGNGFCTMKEFESAVKAYRMAIGMNPRYGPAWNNLGALEGELGNTAAALNDYQRASALGDQLGAGNYAKLQQAIAISQQRRSDDPLRAFWRGQALEAENRARQAWQERLARAQG